MGISASQVGTVLTAYPCGVGPSSCRELAERSGHNSSAAANFSQSGSKFYVSLVGTDMEHSVRGRNAHNKLISLERVWIGAKPFFGCSIVVVVVVGQGRHLW